jgi:hypothetical protein
MQHRLIELTNADSFHLKLEESFRHLEKVGATITHIQFSSWKSPDPHFGDLYSALIIFH